MFRAVSQTEGSMSPGPGNGAPANGPPEVPEPAPMNFGMGAAKGLAVAAGALVLAAAAVIFFSILQTSVPCQFRPVTYAIFTGIVLAAMGAILGGQASMRGNFAKLGVRWTITGGAAFLVLVMAAVWWATHGECKARIHRITH